MESVNRRTVANRMTQAKQVQQKQEGSDSEDSILAEQNIEQFLTQGIN